MNWKTLGRPGYFGDARDRLVDSWNLEYGEKNNWRIAYDVGGLAVPREMGLKLYEDGYYEFLKDNPDKLDWLVNNYSNVWDTAETNVEAEFDYDYPQETAGNHVHDISIRRAVVRSGRWFSKGKPLLHVRWKKSKGYKLNPGVVPFHRPDLIFPGEIKNVSGKNLWWNPGTIEDFYQKNKLLQVAVVKTFSFPCS